MSQTAEFLKQAITGEFNATRMYAKFSEVADKEGYKNIAYLFKSLVYAERIHIKNHNNALGESYDPQPAPFDVAKTLQNLDTAIKGEIHETKEMYPGFIKSIKKDKNSTYNKVAQLSMEWARDVELTHSKVLQIALASLNDGHDLDVNEIYVCRVCGNLVLGKNDKFCPVCGHDPYFYELMERP